MTICTLLEILTHWERRSLRDQGSFVSQITANVNSLSDFLKRTWELSLCNSSTKHRGVFKILSAVEEAVKCWNNSLGATNETNAPSMFTTHRLPY